MPSIPARAAPWRSAGAGIALLVLAVFAALSLWHGVRAASSDASALHARWLVSEWRDGNGPVFTPELWEKTRDDLQAALDTAPGNAHLLDDLGFLYAARALGLGSPALGSQEQVLQHGWLGEAVANYRAATAMRPTFPYSWAYLALAKHLRGEHDAEFWLAFDKALKYGGNESGVQPALAQIAFAQWSMLGAERQRHIASIVRNSHQTSRKQLLEIADRNGVTMPGL